MKTIGINARNAQRSVSGLDTSSKNKVLRDVADQLMLSAADIVAANAKDIENGKNNGMSQALLDRLTLNPKRIKEMAIAIQQIIDLPDPIGRILEEKTLYNGLFVTKVSVPLGVIGMIYEARPNVTVDAFTLCFKSGNAVILKGGKEAINTNIAIEALIRNVLNDHGLDPNIVQLVKSTDRKTTQELMRLHGYVDVLIPRGSASLINAVIAESSIPVIETGSGNCHIYVDKEADLTMALDIIANAKLQRLSVCNSAESLLVHRDIAETLIPLLAQRLKEVTIYGDELAMGLDATIQPATEEDYYTEYLDTKISLKTVDSLQQAIDHVNHYGTKHSDVIITENPAAAEKFLNEVDAAVVYVNASTRFTDGFEFGLGAEIGISTQKLHVRGPMGLEALTSYKYIVKGKGQTRV